MAETTALIVVAGFLVLGFFLYVVLVYNSLVRLKVNIGKAWANIDVLLKQRHDEVPNLIAVVEGYKDFERQVLTDLTKARSAALEAATVPEKARAQQALSGALNQLFAVAENYPQLKAQENFLMLQKRLSELESEIADRRSFYNESVTVYNTRIAQFSDSLLAGAMGLAAQDLFKAAASEREVVQVGLTSS
jgi:LemA protein